MRKTLTSIGKATIRKPKLALIALIATVCYPAINLTIAEWKDAVDSSTTSVWQPELVIDAWFNALTTTAVAVFSFISRGKRLDNDV